MQDIFIEYLVKKVRTPQTILIKALIVVAAVAVSAAALLFGSYLGPFYFLVPIIVLVAWYGAYHLISAQNLEYEYSVTNGELDVDQIIAQRRRKRLVSVNCRDVEAFGRYRPEQHQGKNYQTKIFACDHISNPDLWYCVIRLKQSGLTLVVFNANQKMLEGIKPFLPRPILHEAFRAGQ